MNLTLKRTQFRDDGIFGQMFDDDGNVLFHTLEHSFSGRAKVAVGQYNCIRHVPNRLPYETFMLEEVPPFGGKEVTGILIHVGNYNKDSDGCILIGDLALSTFGQMVNHSRDAFDKFMEMQKDIDNFILTIE